MLCSVYALMFDKVASVIPNEPKHVRGNLRKRPQDHCICHHVLVRCVHRMQQMCLHVRLCPVLETPVTTLPYLTQFGTWYGRMVLSAQSLAWAEVSR
ncbi:hypothetical protein PHMEG_00041608 [Phytophthora megakarya]|uniref:Uncharacterized protein n=1 Tax=Phytophthora megakarya TaxID=4795 RepID=A0A225UBG4_9STRA|nr:hypothetical protein PHMEG_00041608 [Phytophthora megakarya]